MDKLEARNEHLLLLYLHVLLNDNNKQKDGRRGLQEERGNSKIKLIINNVIVINDSVRNATRQLWRIVFSRHTNLIYYVEMIYLNTSAYTYQEFSTLRLLNTRKYNSSCVNFRQ